MRTRNKNFLDTNTNKPAYSFQYFDKQKGAWIYPADESGVMKTWKTEAARDRVRMAYSCRKKLENVMLA